MDADRVAEAIRQFILGPSEPIERRWDMPDALVVQTHRYQYRAEPADWSIVTEAWVDSAVRVLAEGDRVDVVPTFGLLFLEANVAQDEVVFLNDVASMAALGRRLNDGLEPIAYAELLAELHFPPGLGPNARGPQAVSRPSVPGELIRDSSTFLSQNPFVDPSVVAAGLTASRSNHGTTINFQSYVRYLLADFGSALNIYDWAVSAPRDQDATWRCTIAAERIEVTG